MGFSTLSAARNSFNDKLKAKAFHFKTVYVVYDGIEDSQASSGNCIIIFTNKEKATADDKITEIISSYGEGSVILATDDEGLIGRNTEASILRARHCYEFFH